MARGGGLLALLVLIVASPDCGGDAPTTWQCAAEQAGFSRAVVTVDLGKRMPDLTADERTAVCAEFSRALTDSFGTAAYVCKGLSHTPGTLMCQAAYTECLQMPPPIETPIPYCTEKMSGMWSCPITIGQYQACFNDLNGMLFALADKSAVCDPFDPNACGPQTTPTSCEAADCDYTWTD